MSDLPTELSAMLEAVEKYMGEQFAEMLDEAIARSGQGCYWAGRDEERFVWTGTLERL